MGTADLRLARHTDTRRSAVCLSAFGGLVKTNKAGAFPPFIPGCGHLSDRRERERDRWPKK